MSDCFEKFISKIRQPEFAGSVRAGLTPAPTNYFHALWVVQRLLSAGSAKFRYQVLSFETRKSRVAGPTGKFARQSFGAKGWPSRPHNLRSI